MKLSSLSETPTIHTLKRTIMLLQCKFNKKFELFGYSEFWIRKYSKIELQHSSWYDSNFEYLGYIFGFFVNYLYVLWRGRRNPWIPKVAYIPMPPSITVHYYETKICKLVLNSCLTSKLLVVLSIFST